MLAIGIIMIIVKIHEMDSCILQTDRWLKNTPIPGHEYYISGDDMTFEECATFCKYACNNSKQATVGARSNPLITNEFYNATCITNLSLWILRSGETKKHFVLSEQDIREPSSLVLKFRCLCQRRADSNLCLKLTANEIKKTIGNLEFYMDPRVKTYLKAAEDCRTKWNSSIIHYSDPLQYIKLSRSLALEHGSYWLKSHDVTSERNCLALKITTENTCLLAADCNHKLYSICSRLRNASIVLTAPGFVEMIRNMTVDQRKTNKARIKLISAADNRTLTRVIAGGIGVLVIVLVIGLVVVSDIQMCLKRRQS